MAQKKRIINAVDWLKRAPAAQIEKMRAALGDGWNGKSPVVHPKTTEALASLQETERRPKGPVVMGGAFLIDIPRAYALVPGPSDGGIPSWHLLKFEVEGGAVVALEKSVQNLRGVHLQAIEDDILRDA